MLQLSGVKCSLSSQVYKATGEEFLKIAGGQISVCYPQCFEEDLC